MHGMMKSLQSLKSIPVAGLAMGVLSGIGGFVDFGGIISYTNAGAQFRYALLWTLIPGVVGFSIFAEMSGRVAISSGRTMFDVIRSRLGARLAMIPLAITVVVHIMTLLIELAGMALALQLATQIHYLIWILPVALLIVFILWRVRFSRLENIATVLGLSMLVIVVVMFAARPPWVHVIASLGHPSLGHMRPLPLYLYSVAGLLGAYMTPYQFAFYSSGALEERWGAKDLVTNRVTAIIGPAVGSILSLGLMVSGAALLYPRHLSVDSLGTAALPVRLQLGLAGWWIFIFATFALSMGAGLEAALSGAYEVCQYFGWEWGKTARNRNTPMFHLAYFVMMALALAIVFTGVDPIQVTTFTLAIGAFSLPFMFGPLLIIANDVEFMGEQRNTRANNVAAGLIMALLIAVTLATIPLMLLSGSI